MGIPSISTFFQKDNSNFCIFQAGLLSLADAHGSKAAHLSVVAIIMGLIIVMWITILRIMLLSNDSV